ncbi:MAG: 3D domain-containing protein [Clostridiales bacterium]|nr:3D domain-containing protein [Clostridiales bacterium]
MRNKEYVMVTVAATCLIIAATMLAWCIVRIGTYEAFEEDREEVTEQTEEKPRRKLDYQTIYVCEYGKAAGEQENEQTDEPELTLIDSFIATAYCDYGTTATGTTTTEGRTLAVNPADIPYGSHVWLYAEDGELIGDYYAEDTGGNLLRQNYVIDIYMPEYDDCIAWGARRVIVYAE